MVSDLSDVTCFAIPNQSKGTAFPGTTFPYLLVKFFLVTNQRPAPT